MKRISLGWSLAATIAGCSFILFAGGTDKGIEGWQPLNDQLEQAMGVEGEAGVKASSAASLNETAEEPGAPAEDRTVSGAAKTAQDVQSEPAGSGKDLSTGSDQVGVNGAAAATAPANESAAQTPSSSAQSGLINVNTADAATLMELPGIGEAKAKAIIDYRNQSGPFRSVADLMNVKGIGPKMLEKMKPYVGL